MKYQCEMIKDLMLPCADGTGSAEGRTAVREHVHECDACAAKWRKLTGSKNVPKKAPRMLPKKAKIGIAASIITAFAAFIVWDTVIPFIQTYAKCSDTPKGAIQKAVETSNWITGPYSEEQIVGSYEDGHDIYYWMMNDIGCGAYYVHPFHGRYLCGSTDSTVIPASKPICLLHTVQVFTDKNEALDVYPFYTQDTTVQTIRMTIGTETETGTCNEKGFCLLSFPHPTVHSYSATQAPPQKSCEALDQSGNVLYTLAEPDYENEQYNYYWKAAE